MILRLYESEPVSLIFILFLHISVILKFIPSGIFPLLLLTTYVINPMNWKVCSQIMIGVCDGLSITEDKEELCNSISHKIFII